MVIHTCTATGVGCTLGSHVSKRHIQSFQPVKYKGFYKKDDREEIMLLFVVSEIKGGEDQPVRHHMKVAF